VPVALADSAVAADPGLRDVLTYLRAVAANR
jgi:hypothetical protein